MNPVAPPNSRLLTTAATVVAILLAGYWAGRVAIGENHHEDLWIYSSGPWLAMRGETPYDVTKIHARVDEHWAGDENLSGNSGFFLTPQALLVFAPWAVLPWELAKPLWCVFTIGLATAAGWGVRTLTDAPLPGWFTAAAVVAILLNPLSLFVLIVGQSTLLVLSCVILGEAAWRGGWRRISCILWAVCFIKPHIALPLLPLAWYLSGWRRAAEVVVWAAGLNVLAGVVFFGKPLFVLEYLKFVQGGHQTVEFNRVAVNKQITGWNRLLVAGGGPAIDLGMIGTLASYAGMLVIIGLRCVAFGKVQPTREWCFALVGCASLYCCQLLPYELPMLVLGLPYLAGLINSDRVRDRLAAVVLALTAAFAFIPGGDGEWYYQLLARFVGGSWLEAVLQSHRAFGVMLTTAAVLATGPVRTAVQFVTPSGSSASPSFT
ncbi:MAG: DUF2029 domain-containing protein [Fimbriiglobus sp.]|jgi:hypothetical protein|nr:DUF2029 domain-containing protein [Fimbriiglobus sp.]